MLVQEVLQQQIFSNAEQQVIAYVLTEREQIANQTTKEIANATFTHPSILVRLAKKVGYSGWSELKEAYLEELAYLNQHFQEIDANMPFTEKDSLMSVAKKIAKVESEAINDTAALLKHDDLRKVVNLLGDASTIKIFANNVNTLISQDFKLNMGRIGKKVSISQLSGEYLYEALNCEKGSVAILISYSGDYQWMKDVISLLKEKEIPIIALTHFGHSALRSQADCTLSISTREKLYSKIGNFTTNTSICYLLDTIYSCVFAENYTENLNHIVNISKRIDTRKSDTGILKEKQ